jgi:hypothetical protein
MPTYSHPESLFLKAQCLDVQRAFPDFWRAIVGTPLNRPFAGPRPSPVQPGVYKQVKGSPRNRVETTISFKAAPGGTLVTYERQ